MTHLPLDAMPTGPSGTQEVFPLAPGARFRLVAGVEYLGSVYSGWQVQGATEATVQHRLQHALSSVANEPVQVFCAGRTDAGVHATGQVIHFDTRASRPVHGWVLGTNTRLPGDISLQWLRPADTGFHARFSARSRRYRYVIYNHWVPAPSLLGRAVWERRPLDVEPMQAAARLLEGRHDFSAFRAAECQAHSPVRRVESCRVYRQGRLIVLDVTADAFLHHMVRNMAGVLMTVGAGERSVAWAAEVLEGRDRARGGVTARPEGLYLTDVRYDARYALPVSGDGPHFLDAGAL